MNTSIQQFVTESIGNSSWITFFIVFWAGAVLSFASCTIIRLPVVAGYIGAYAGDKKKGFILLFSFVSALVVSYTILGILFGVASRFIFQAIKWDKYVYYFLGFILFIMGLNLTGFIHFSFFHVHKHKLLHPHKIGILGAFLFGIIFAIFEAPACPCCGPVLFTIASLTFTQGNLIFAVSLFFFYALGQAFPILLIGVFTNIIKHISPKIFLIEPWIKMVSGDFMIVMSLFFFLVG